MITSMELRNLVAFAVLHFGSLLNAQCLPDTFMVGTQDTVRTVPTAKTLVRRPDRQTHGHLFPGDWTSVKSL